MVNYVCAFKIVFEILIYSDYFTFTAGAPAGRADIDADIALDAVHDLVHSPVTS